MVSTSSAVGSRPIPSKKSSLMLKYTISSSGVVGATVRSPLLSLVSDACGWPTTVSSFMTKGGRGVSGDNNKDNKTKNWDTRSVLDGLAVEGAEPGTWIGDGALGEEDGASKSVPRPVSGTNKHVVKVADCGERY